MDIFLKIPAVGKKKNQNKQKDKSFYGGATLLFYAVVDMKSANFALSFANDFFQLVTARINELKQTEIVSMQSLPYPFAFEYKTLFNPENLALLAGQLEQQKTENKIEELDLSVAIPLNYSFVKRVAIPLDSDDRLVFNQTRWDLNEYLPGQVDDYKIIKTEREYIYSNYKEWQFICIPKTVLNNLIDFAAKAGANLKKVLLDHSAFDNYLSSRQLTENNINRLVVNVDRLNLYTHLFIDNGYFLSFMDTLSADKQDAERFEEIGLLLAAHFEESREKIEQLPFVAHPDLHIFLSGVALSDHLVEHLKDKVKTDLVLLPVEEDFKTAGLVNRGFTEALGVLFD